MKTTTKLFVLILAAIGLYACDNSDDDYLVYIAHPEKVKVKTPENVNYVKLYGDKVEGKVDTLKILSNKGNDNLKDESDNPEKELSTFWPDYFDALPGGKGQMGYIGLEGSDSKVFVAVCPLGGYVFPSESFKKFSDFFSDPAPTEPDWESIVAQFPDTHKTRDAYTIESGMSYREYTEAVTGKVLPNDEVCKALDAALEQFNTEYSAWVAKWLQAKTDFYNYIKNVKYEFLKDTSTKYYIWGNTTEMKAGDTPLNGSLKELNSNTDAATVAWGEKWHTPNADDLLWIFNLGSSSGARYERRVYYDDEENVLVTQMKKSSSSYGKAVRFRLNGYMLPDGTVQGRNKQFVGLTRIHSNAQSQICCAYFDTETKKYGYKFDFAIERGYEVYPVRYSK